MELGEKAFYSSLKIGVHIGEDFSHGDRIILSLPPALERFHPWVACTNTYHQSHFGYNPSAKTALLSGQMEGLDKGMQLKIVHQKGNSVP